MSVLVYDLKGSPRDYLLKLAAALENAGAGIILMFNRRGSLWGLVVLAAAFGIFFLGMLGGINFMARASVVFVLLGGVLWVGGRTWTRYLAFPVLFLLLSVPIPQFAMIRISFPLQVFAAEAAEATLSWVGVPILRTGNIIHLPHTQLEVAEPWSGR